MSYQEAWKSEDTLLFEYRGRTYKGMLWFEQRNKSGQIGIGLTKNHSDFQRSDSGCIDIAPNFWVDSTANIKICRYIKDK